MSKVYDDDTWKHCDDSPDQPSHTRRTRAQQQAFIDKERAAVRLSHEAWQIQTSALGNTDWWTAAGPVRPTHPNSIANEPHPNTTTATPSAN